LVNLKHLRLNRNMNLRITKKGIQSLPKLEDLLLQARHFEREQWELDEFKLSFVR